MHRALSKIHVRRGGLSSQVQHGCPGKPRFDDGAACVRSAGPSARKKDTQFTRYAGIRVGHVTSARFASRHDKSNGIPTANCIEHRNVMDRNYAKRRGDADLLEKLGDQIANENFFSRVRHGDIP